LLEILPLLLHKLKNKLTPILGFTQILLNKIDDPGMQERLLKIESNACELDGLLNTLKSYFKPCLCLKQRGSLNTLMAPKEQSWREVAGRSGIRMVIEKDDALPLDELNGGQVVYMIDQLFKNAVEAILYKDRQGLIFDSAKTIELKTERLDRGYRLVITDNGIGITEEDLPRIWMPFFSSFPGGVGIGLVICERVIKNHGARAEVSSKRNCGTRVEIHFSPGNTDHENKRSDIDME